MFVISKAADGEGMRIKFRNLYNLHKKKDANEEP